MVPRPRRVLDSTLTLDVEKRIDLRRGPWKGWVISGRYTEPNQTVDAPLPLKRYSSNVVHCVKKTAVKKAREYLLEHGGHWKVEPNYTFENWTELVNWHGPGRPRARHKL